MLKYEYAKTARRCTMAAIALLAAGLAPAALAQDGEEDRELLQEVIVTAQFVKQDLQDTPIAITAITGDQLDRRGQDNTTMIGAQAPNVQLQSGPSAQGNSLIAFIRGVGQTDNAPTLEPGVGIYIDNVYFSNVQGTLLDLLDIDRVEVLRGPQGTLAGRNSIGGAIKLYSRLPDAERDGYFEVGGGSYDQLRVRAGSSFTLVEDRLFARLTGLINERDGYVDNFDFGCLYPGSGVPTARAAGDCLDGTLGGLDTRAFRGALRWLPSDSLEVNIAAEWIDDESEPSANLLIASGPTVAPVFAAPPSMANPLPLAWPWLDTSQVPPMYFPSALNPCVFVTDGGPGSCTNIQQALGGPAISDGYTSFSNFFDPQSGFAAPRVSTNEQQNLSLRLDWQLTGDIELQSITGIRNYEVLYGNDDDASPVSLSTQRNTQDHSSLTQEFRLNGSINDNLSYTLGAFYRDAETEIGGHIVLRNSALDFLVDDVVEADSHAIFVNAIWDISDRFQLAAGLRYSDDEKTFNFARYNPDGSEPAACVVVTLPDGSQVVDPTSSPNCLVGGINDAEPQVFSDDRTDYRVALSFFPTDTATLYGSVSTGYKAGGANSRPFFEQQLVAHNSEEVTSYEIGGKFELANRSLRVNTALFTNDYSDVIVTLFNCEAQTGAPFGSPCFLPVNGGEAEVSGFELEFDWAPIPDLLIEGSLATVDFDYTEANPASGLSTATIQPYTPETTWSLGLQYVFDTPIGNISPRIDAIYQDDMFTQPENTPEQFIDGYTLINGSVRWTDADEDWALTLEGRNLTDEYYLYNVTDFTGGLNGFATANPALDRTWLITLRRNF